MDYWSTNFYKANNERSAAILDKVKKGIWLFLECEEIERKRNFFLFVDFQMMKLRLL